MSSGPTADTFGLFCSIPNRRVNLHALAFGLPAEHFPAQQASILVSVETGPSGEPLGAPIATHEADRIALQLVDVTAEEFEEYAELVEAIRLRNGAQAVSVVRWSPLGSVSYEADDWLLISTTEGWMETEPFRYAGPLVLVKQGAAV